MKSQTLIRWQVIFLYIFGVAIIYLIGTIYVPFFHVLFIAMLVAPVISIITLISNRLALRYMQDFSQDHPVKGATVEYYINFTNSFILPISLINVKFHSVTPTQDMILPELALFLGPRETVKKTFPIHCKYRGIYKVGFQELTVEDLFHFFKIKITIWYKTFYVYPRLIELERFATGFERMMGGSKALPFGGDPDYSMFDELKEYRYGESLRHIYWKKSATIGIPILKKFDSTPDPAVHIYFDLRYPEATELDISYLDIEDVSLEILVAVVHYFLKYGTRCSVKAPGEEYYNFEGANIEDFNNFYKSTINLIFQDTISLEKLYRAIARREELDTNAIFFITHRMDYKLFTLIQASLKSNRRLSAIVNQTGFTTEQKIKNQEYFNNLRDQGAKIIVVNNSKTLVDDLEGRSK